METLTTPSRLVAPGTARLPLSRGDYLIVKHRLNAGETLDLFERAAPELDVTNPGALAHLSPTKTGLAIVTAYLLDWSFADLDGAVIPIRGLSTLDKESALRLIDFDSLIEVMNAVAAHDAAMREKKPLSSAAGS